MKHAYIYIYIYEGWPQSSQVDQYILIECNQMRSIFQHSLLCSSHTSSIGVAVLGSFWSTKSSAVDMMSSYEFFIPPLYIVFLCIYTMNHQSLTSVVQCLHLSGKKHP